jgi:hypothetical protein
LRVCDLTAAQKAICEVAVRLDRDLLGRKTPAELLPVPQYDMLEEFRPWLPEHGIRELWRFWSEHRRAVNAWIPGWAS